MSKEGIGYFSFDTDFFHADKKVKLIKSEFGSKGVTILIYALCAIYSDKGYYAEWGEDDCYLWSEDLGCDCSPNLIGEVISRCVKRGIFDEEVFNASGVLTSHGIQIRFLKAAAKRERIKIIKEYALFDLEELKEGMRNKVYFFPLKVASSSQKVASSSQKVASSSQSKESKVKESKVKESKVKNTICAEPEEPSHAPPVISLTLNDKSLYGVFQSDIDGWAELYPAVDIVQELKKMKGWLDSNPTKRKTRRGISRFINSWLARTQDSGGSRTGQERGTYKNQTAQMLENHYNMVSEWAKEMEERNGDG